MITFVHPLRGGGPADETAKPSSTVRNMLATWLLTQGGDMLEVAPFVSKISQAGSLALAEILDIRDKKIKLEAISKLAASLNVEMPSLQFKHQQNKKKFQDKTSELNALDVNCIRIKPKFFINQDGTECCQRTTPQPNGAGVSVLSAPDAKPWLNQCISADEQAIVVLGICPCEDKQKCYRLNLPGYYGEDPMIFDACLHQVGQKPVKIHESQVQVHQVASSNVVALTAFKNEIGPKAWTKLVDAPVKVAMALLFQERESPQLLSPPWGRTFQDANGRVNKVDSVSFQCHIRIAHSDLSLVLKPSGLNGVYSTPKTDDRRVSLDYQVIWLALEPVQLAVTAGSHDKCLGLVRNSRSGNKVTRGLRFAKEDFASAFAMLRPNEEVPTHVACKFLFKASPTPVGAGAADVMKWIEKQNWKAKPLRALSATVWLCGAEEMFDLEFVPWNDQMILIKWVKQRPTNQPLVLAGSTTKTKLDVHAVKSAWGLSLKEDPWAGYKPLHDSSAAKPNVSIPVAVARKLEAPIEDRFMTQSKELDSFKESTQLEIQALKAGMQELQTATKKDVQKELQLVRTEAQTHIRERPSVQTSRTKKP